MRFFTSFLTVLLCSLPALANMSNSIDYTRLNIVGDAVEGAWNLNANPMTSIDRGVFTWTGTLTADRPFKFMNSDDGWHKHVVATSKDEIIKDGEIHHLDFYADWTLPDALDNKFMVKETGVYVLTVDLRHMSVRLSRQQPATVYPDKYYITGSALDDNVIEMDKIGNFEFKQSLQCSPGNIILMDTPTRGEDTRFFIPVFEDVDISFGMGYSSSLCVTNDADARGWSVSVPGDYALYISCGDNRYSGRRYRPRKHLYLVGGCCESSWNYSDQSNCIFLPNPENADELIWEGELRKGWDGNIEPDRFKILTEQSWTSETYHPYVPDTPAEGTLPIRTTAGEDSKWTIAKDGKYRMTVNTKKETISVEYLTTEQTISDNIDNTANVSIETDDSLRLSLDNNKVELTYTPEPVEVSVVSIAGNIIAQKSGITEGIVADNLAMGVYLILVKGDSLNKSYKVSTGR